MEFVAATNNAHKLAEMRRILVRMGHTVLSQREAGVLLEPEETGATFEANAAIKAQAVCEACRKPTIADDSGLCVDALGGVPGVYSARYSGVHGDDGANNRKLLAALEGVPAAARGAFYKRRVRVAAGRAPRSVCGAGAPAPSALRKGRKRLWVRPAVHPGRGGPAGPGCGMRGKRRAAHLRPAFGGRKDAISHRARALALMEQELPAFLCGYRCSGAVCGPCLPVERIKHRLQSRKGSHLC